MYADITIKARCYDPTETESILQQHNAKYIGLDAQTDIFYKVEHGKLKLRRGAIENVLIHYNRTQNGNTNQTEVFLYLKNPGSTAVQDLYGDVEILAELKKLRKIYFIDNVKFHIDQIEGHGQFIEIEAIDLTGTIGNETLQQQCNYYKELLHIVEEDILTNSYIDL